MAKENYFILESFNEEMDMRVQFHYWTEGDKCYSSTELEDGTTRWQGEITEEQYVSALETLHNA